MPLKIQRNSRAPRKGFRIVSRMYVRWRRFCILYSNEFYSFFRVFFRDLQLFVFLAKGTRFSGAPTYVHSHSMIPGIFYRHSCISILVRVKQRSPECKNVLADGSFCVCLSELLVDRLERILTRRRRRQLLLLLLCDPVRSFARLPAK